VHLATGLVAALAAAPAAALAVVATVAAATLAAAVTAAVAVASIAVTAIAVATALLGCVRGVLLVRGVLRLIRACESGALDGPDVSPDLRGNPLGVV
jgi:hypothetical protein